jgi:hypothetical protein
MPVQIPPGITHEKWLEDFMDYMLNPPYTIEDEYGEADPEDVHKHVLKHLYGRPQDPQKGLEKFIRELGTDDDKLDFGGFREIGGAKGMVPFIQEYVKYGASLRPLRAYINALPGDSEFKEALTELLEAEPLPLLPASPTNSNNNQNGGKRRRSRKSGKLRRKNRRTQRRRNY